MSLDHSFVMPTLSEVEVTIENPWLIAVIALVIAVVIRYFNFLLSKGLAALPGTIRDFHKLMLQTARQLQLEYSDAPADEDDLLNHLSRFHFTGSHPAGRFSRLLRGKVAGPEGSYPVCFFDFVSKQQKEFTVRQTVLLIETSSARLPAFEVYPTRLTNRIAEIAGAQDIDPRDDAEFSRKFSVKGIDEMEVRTALTPEFTRFFKDHPEYSFESSGRGSFLLYRDGYFTEGKTLEALQSAYREQLDRGLELAGLIQSRK